jgi:hypothetical protein
MTVESRAAFARRIGRARSWVTQLAQAGRLVLVADGRVDVEASLERMGATADPSHAALAERHAATRAAKGQGDAAAPAAATPAAGAADAPGSDDDSADDSDHKGAAQDPTFAHWRARSERAKAMKAEHELAILNGALLRRDQVIAAITAAAARWRTASSDWCDHVAPTVLGITDEGRVASVLRDGMHQLHAELAKGFDQIGSGHSE